MANVLILADSLERTKRISAACSGWNADVLLNTAEVDKLTELSAASLRACDLVILDHVANDADEDSRPRALQYLRELETEARVIVVGVPTGDSEERSEIVFQYLEGGAAGYITYGEIEERLVDVIGDVLNGGTSIEPAMTIELIERTVALHDALEMMRPYAATVGQAEVLTRRQQEVLELMASGYTNKQIADELYISVGTVKNHVHRILDVLRASSREQAAQYYQFLQTPAQAA